MVLVALPSVNLDALQSAIDEQLSTLPRASMTKTALEHSKIISVENREEALAFSNAYAPEHLIINTEDAASYVDGISNAGSVFLGRFTPESVGDYASGRPKIVFIGFMVVTQEPIMCCRRTVVLGCTVAFHWMHSRRR